MNRENVANTTSSVMPDEAPIKYESKFFAESAKATRPEPLGRVEGGDQFVTCSGHQPRRTPRIYYKLELSALERVTQYDRVKIAQIDTEASALPDLVHLSCWGSDV